MQRAMIAWVLLCAGIPASGVFALAQGQQTSAAQQAATATPPERIRIGGNVAVANLIHRVDPVYPPIAKAAKVQGTVVLHAIIGKDGAVKEVEFVSGPPLLMRAAMDAVREWRYKPTLLNGNPVEVDTTISVIFALGDGQSPAAPPQGEQISLKDGTKIVGKVIAVDGDTFTVQTSFSKMEIPRAQILSIVFAENSPAAASTLPVTVTVPKTVEQSISGGVYTNGIGQFTLKVPDGWQANDELARKTSAAIGALTGTDHHEMILMQTIPNEGSAKEEVQILASSFQNTFEGFEKLNEAPIQLDGVEGDTLSFRAIIPLGNVRTQEGTGQPANTTVKTPIRYFVVILPEPNQMLMLMCAAPETLYPQFEPAFTNIINSFHSTAAKTGSAPPQKP